MEPSRAIAGPVLVRLPNWLGDALMARPFLAALRRRAAGQRITATGPSALLALLAGDGAWDESLAWPPSATEAVRVRRERWDTAFVLPPSFSSAWFALRSGARQRVGFAADARSPLLTRALRRPSRGDVHLACEYLALLGGADGDDGALPVPAPLHLDDAAHAEAARVLREAGVPGGTLVILAPGAIYGPAKRWPVERFAALARALADAGHAVVACGGGSERAACDALVAAAAGACTSLAGRTSLAAQAALCARATAVVSNDSGMAHLAAACGAPTVAIFGSTSSSWTAPLGPRVRIVQRPPVCSPCFRRTCAIGYVCLEAVEVSDVSAAITDVVRSAGKGGDA